MAGYTINQLPTLTTASSSDLLPVFSSTEGSAYKMSLNTLLTWFQGNFISPDFTVVTSAPSSTGFTLALDDTSDNLLVILSPTGTFATGTITLPAVADLADGQTIIVCCSQRITALTISGNGATLSGDPSSIAAGGSFAMRYRLATTTWHCVSGGDRYVDLAIERYIRDENNDIGVEIDANTGGAPVTAWLGLQNGDGTTANIVAKGSTADISLDLEAKGAGSMTLTSTTSITLSTPVTDFQGGRLQTLSRIDMTPVAVASLGSAATAGSGSRRFVSDANATTFASIVAGGGANPVPVYSDGTNWRIG
jgi:hypothetical protein